MQLNFLVFPKPAASYTHSELFGKLIYVPKDSRQWAVTAPYVTSKCVSVLQEQEEKLKPYGGHRGECIPCLYLPWSDPSSKVLIYFHGNAEDLKLTQELMDVVRGNLQVHVIVMEYEGYGVYEGSTAADKILRDAEIVFHYVLQALGFSTKDVILFGRSIGSGPACLLASKYSVHSLILMSAFTSLRAVVKGYVGSLMQYLVADRFNNREYIKTVQCPVFFMHGKKDDIVPCQQSEELKQSLSSHSRLHMPEDMDHNCFDFEKDFIIPLLDYYYSELKFTSEPQPPQTGFITLPIKAFNKPIP